MGGIGPPAEDCLDRGSGGGRRPGRGHRKLSHSNATSLVFWCAKNRAFDSLRHGLLRRCPIPAASGGTSPLRGEDTYLFAFELRLSLFAECFDAFVRVLRHEYAADRLALDRKPDVERGAVALGDRKLGVADRDARPGGQLGGVFDRACSARRGVSSGGEELRGRDGHDDGVDVSITARVVDRAGKRTQEFVVVAVRRGAVQDADSDLAFLFEIYTHPRPSTR